MLGTITSVVHCAQRFFPPHEALPMLKCIMPPFDGSDISTVLTVQTQMARWLPLSHPQEWLPTVFALWQSFNSTLGTAIWLDLMARTAELHLDPAISGPQHLEHYRQKAESPSPPQGAAEDLHLDPTWPGLRKYVSLFDEQQWQWITTECLRTMEVPVGSSSQTSGDFLSIAGAGNHDEQVPKSLSSFISTPPRTNSLAHIFVNCMMEDAVTMPPSALMTPEPSTPATPLTGRPTPALGGSRALDSLAKFIQATESFFHPSNIGSYSLKLVNFCFKLSAQFYHRWLLERKPTCRTPKAWRLTKEIRREFVLQLRTVMLLSMYVKDAYLMSLSHVTLRILAYLEPESVTFTLRRVVMLIFYNRLIIPSVLERAVPALETTLETHRTIATLSSLATTAAAFLSRENAPFAAKHLAALLDLSIPGIDLNDPGKTRQTCVFITQAISQVTVFDDLNRPEYLQTLPQSKSRNNSMLIDGDGQEELTETQDEEPLCDPQAFGPSGSRAQEDKLLRESTQTFPDFTVRFFKAIFSIFENLPEPGKGGKAGGSSEETMLAAIHHLTEAICAKMSPRLFDDALRLFYEFVAHSPRSNCARVSGRLLSAFARARPSKTLSLFIPLCCSKIKQELDYGAASIPSSTTSTSPLTEDTTFQWYCYLLNSLITECGPALLPFADKVLALLREMLYRVRSERGYTHLGRILSSLLEDQASTWIHMYDTSLERDTDEFIAQSHLSWGQVYEAREAPVKWHVPSSEEIDVVMRTLREITVPALERLESLVSEESAAVPSDSTWAKEYAVCLIMLAF